jgi:Transposase IS66 family
VPRRPFEVRLTAVVALLSGRYRLSRRGVPGADEVVGVALDLRPRRGMEPTNNVSERALRPAVLWRKGCFGSDTEGGSRFAERLLTVVATCRQHGRGLLVFLVAADEAALRGTAPPSLLPAG